MNDNNTREQQLRAEILEKVAEYAKEFHVGKQKEKDDNFKEGDRVPYASRVYDEKEMVNLVDSPEDIQRSLRRSLRSTWGSGL